MFLHSWHPQAVAFHLGSLQVHWYGIFLALGTIGGLFLAQRLARRYQLDPNRVFDLAFIVLISGFLGARLYHVSNEWSYYTAHPTEIVKVWNGGLALHGGLLFGLIAMVIMAKRWHWNAWLLADIFAPAVALGQALGRWGNYFNQELFGRPTTLPWGIPVDPLHRPVQYLSSAFFHPTFLYESLGLLLICGGLIGLHAWQLRRPTEQRRTGTIVLVYVIAYSALRIATEALRLDRTPIIGHVRLPILMSILFIFIAACLLLYRNLRRHATA